MNMEELFRQKLGNAEIIPGASVSSNLMRKVARREFLRFNPAQFNIFYLGTILVAGISAAIIFSSITGNTAQLTPLNISSEISKNGSTQKAIVPDSQTVIQESDSLNVIASESIKSEPIIKLNIGSKTEPSHKSGSREIYSITPVSIQDLFTKNGLTSELSIDPNALQGGLSKDSAFFETSATEGCPPLKIRFYNISNSYDSCMWTFGDGGYSNIKDPEWIFDVEGEYKVKLYMFGSDGKQITSSTVITVYPKPLARFEITPQRAAFGEMSDNIRFYNYSTNAISFNWDFGDGSTSELFEPKHSYAKPGNYNLRLMVSSDYGCYDSLVVMNALSGSECFIKFPNAFIPDSQGPTGGDYSSRSDEVAQVFHPDFAGVSDYQLKIFSKLGILIFETRDINIGWDGYFKGQLSDPGVYVWKVRGNFRNGEAFTKMGDVTLLKNE